MVCELHLSNSFWYKKREKQNMVLEMMQKKNKSLKKLLSIWKNQ